MDSEIEEQGLATRGSWTFDSLYLHLREIIKGKEAVVNARIDGLEKATAQALTAATLAAEKSERTYNQRFESVNEFREQMRDQAAQFAQSAYVDSRDDALAKRIDSLEAQVDRNTGAGSNLKDLRAWIGWIAALIAVAVAFLAYQHGQPYVPLGK